MDEAANNIMSQDNQIKYLLEVFKNNYNLYIQQLNKVSSFFTVVFLATIAFDIQTIQNITHSTIWDCLVILAVPSLSALALITSYLVSNKLHRKYNHYIGQFIMTLDTITFSQLQAFEKSSIKHYDNMIMVLNYSLAVFSLISAIFCALLKYRLLNLVFELSLFMFGTQAALIIVLLVYYCKNRKFMYIS